MNLREFARGQSCTARIPQVCNQNPETVVLAHCNKLGIGGVGMKSPDVIAAHVCSACHDELDGRTHNSGFGPDALEPFWFRAILRTLDRVAANFDLVQK